MRPTTAKLALEDGSVYCGQVFGALGERTGEVCFNTSMTGYQEILTDPSYHGQIVVMTYPHIGNYGVNDEDLESSRPWLAGFVVREVSRVHSNFRATGRLHDFLARHGVIGIEGIDTRQLVRVLRSAGALKGILSTEDLDDKRLVERARTSPGLVGRDLVRDVVPSEVREWKEPLNSWTALQSDDGGRPCTREDHIIALDFGMKSNIARHLCHLGARVTILPGTATADEVLGRTPTGVFLSNGPGDPEPLHDAIATTRQLMRHVPIFGICLGHQILALACGAKTFKLRFGHRGTNQPVLNRLTGRVEITSQNHGFSVCEETLPAELEITHSNLNDHTIAGLRHRELPSFGVQYHPEASAGPHDSHYLFSQFAELMHRHRYVNA